MDASTAAAAADTADTEPQPLRRPCRATLEPMLEPTPTPGDTNCEFGETFTVGAVTRRLASLSVPK
ncbi:hypothetical protein EGO51_18935 [Haloarcula hispanica]|nr:MULTISPECIES: hypothetical protein [Haloarcula]KAA9404578.1 hypothetical protein EGO51_18935 [Haloarcula hispanica]MUV51103.1 hypothetical protein [Haloarcula sp. CBA1122]